jgi:lipid-A-disaccharide synthase
MSRPPRILISAGETSGDRLGAGLARALLRRRPELELVGMGGPQMRAAGIELIQDAEQVAVVGIFEVLAHLPEIRAAMRRLEGELERRPPDLVVPVDFPDFNLRLAARSVRAGVPVVYFVSPQVWAWRRGRIRTIRRLVRRMLVLFPFEVAFYERAGVPVTFVGHPLVEAVGGARPLERLRAAAGLDPQRPAIALMPGSRRSELRRLLEPMLGAAARIRQRYRDVQFLLPLAAGLPREPVQARIDALGLAEETRLGGEFPQVLAACEAGVVASGTASLEAALEGLPLVVVYRMNPLTYLLGRALVRLDAIALPNLVAGRRLVPELIQGDCNPGRIAAELADFLERPDRAARTREALLELRSSLGGPGAFDRAAEAVLDELGGLEAK